MVEKYSNFCTLVMQARCKHILLYTNFAFGKMQVYHSVNFDHR